MFSRLVFLQTERQSKSTPCIGHIRPRCSSALRLSPSQLEPVWETQHCSEIFIFRQKPKQSADTSLPLGRFYCDLKNKVNEFISKINWHNPSFVTFLIQQYGFVNLWSGFVTALMDGFQFVSICFALAVICKSSVCPHKSNLSSSHWFPAWKVNISHQAKNRSTGDIADCHMMVDSHWRRWFQFTAELKWHPVGTRCKLLASPQQENRVFIQIPVCRASSKLQCFF